MEHRIESTGRSVDEALQRALDALGARRADVRVEILDSGSSGFLGLIGSRPVRVRVERLLRRHDSIRDLVVDLLASMQIPAEVQVEQNGELIDVSITTQGLDGLLIGRRGQTLTALQHVIGRLISKEFGQNGRVEVDVGDYRRRREAQLVEKARALALKVKATGREINLEPLHAPDRRIVHLALAGIQGVRTYTVGQGLHRNVVIAPDPRSVERAG
jgi:spoIIIJ-associated protein